MPSFPIPSRYKIGLIDASSGLENGIPVDTADASALLVNVKDFGAIGDGAADETTAFQRTETARALNGGTFYVPPGTYRLNGTVAFRANDTRFHMSANAILLCMNAAGPALLFAGGSQVMRRLWIDGLRIQAGVAGYKQPLVTFGDANAIVNYTVRNVFLDGQNLQRNGMRLLSAFEAVYDGVFVFNFADGIGCECSANALNSGNITFANWWDNLAPVAFAINCRTEDLLSQNIINALVFLNCKHVRTAQTVKFFQATTTGAAQFATVIPVQAGQGANFAAGDWIQVCDAVQFNAWVTRVANVAGDNLTISDAAGLPFALAAGDFVVNGQWEFVFGGGTRSVTAICPHWERCNGAYCCNTQSVTLLHPTIDYSQNLRRGVCAVRNTRGIEIVQPFSTVALGAQAVLLHQFNDGVNNFGNGITGPVIIPTGGGALLQRDGGFGLFVRRRTLGEPTLLGVWHQETPVNANQAAVQLTGPMQAIRSLRMRTAGALIACVATVSVARAAGTLTATVFKNGAATTLTAIINAASTTNTDTELQFITEPIGFVPGDQIDVRVTTDAGWLPTANTLDVEVWAEC